MSESSFFVPYTVNDAGKEKVHAAISDHHDINDEEIKITNYQIQNDSLVFFGYNTKSSKSGIGIVWSKNKGENLKINAKIIETIDQDIESLVGVDDSGAYHVYYRTPHQAEDAIPNEITIPFSEIPIK